jgi:hypothetical protein
VGKALEDTQLNRGLLAGCTALVHSGLCNGLDGGHGLCCCRNLGSFLLQLGGVVVETVELSLCKNRCFVGVPALFRLEPPSSLGALACALGVEGFKRLAVVLQDSAALARRNGGQTCARALTSLLDR